MGLSHELISQFAKLVTEEKKTDNGTIVYGKVVVDENGQKYVQLDGSTELTPITEEDDLSKTSSTADVQNDDRVSVMIKNHTATITGNISSPAARTSDVVQVTEAQILLAEKIQVQDGYIADLQADMAEIGDLKAASAKIGELEADNVKINETLEAQKADITNLKATKIDASVVEANYATIENLEATSAYINSLEADYGSFRDLTAANLNATNADIKDLKANSATIDQLYAVNAEVETLKAKDIEIEGTITSTNADVKNLKANSATIDQLNAVDAKITNLDATYAEIDFANIGEAAIKKLFTDSGIIGDLVMKEGKVTGELVGVTIIGDLIKANTLKTDRLVIKGSDGNYYSLTTDFNGLPGVTPVEEESIHGSVIAAKSITATEIAVSDLTAFEAAIAGFTITKADETGVGRIYSGTKASVDADVIPGIYLDNTGQVSFGDETQHIKYYKTSDDKYKLAIAADDILIESKSVADSLEESKATNTVMGERVRIDDLSKVEHTLDVKVKSKNFISPYYTEATSISGVTVTPNDDNSLTINGTATARSVIFICSRPYTLYEPGTYTFTTGVKLPSGVKVFLEQYSTETGGWFAAIGSIQPGESTITFTVTENAYIGGYIEVSSEASVSNVKLYPQLELGETSTSYTPYVDIATVNVIRSGKNLLTYPYAFTSKTTSGVTYTVNEDGGVTIKGTATTGINVVIQNLPGLGANMNASKSESATNGTYTISKRLNYLNGNVCILIQKGDTVDETIYPQVELGTVLTEYEPCKDNIQNPINEDGTVSKITSLYPTTTLISDTPGVVLEVKYNKNNQFGDDRGTQEALGTSTSKLSITNAQIMAEVSNTKKLIEESNSDLEGRLVSVEKKASVSMSGEDVNIAISRTISENGVSKLKTTTGYTFDDEGMNVSKSNSNMKTKISDDGMTVDKKTGTRINEETGEVEPLFETTLKANSSGVDAVDLKASTYLIIGGRSRFQNYEVNGQKRTACFWVGG